MAIRWIEGFEIGRMQTELQDKYPVYAGPVNTAYTGRLAGNAGYPSYLVTPSLGSQSTWIIGIGFKRSSSSSHQYLDIYSGADRQFTLQFYSNGIGTDFNIKLLRGVTVLCTSTTTLEFNTWYFIELKVTIDPSAGAYELRINEIQDTNCVASGVNTAESGVGNADVFSLRSPFNSYIDDIYIADDTGSDNNDFLGDCQIEGILPNGAGDRTEMTPSAGANYQCVDDPQGGYSLTDYVQDGTIGHGDLYEFEDPSVITGAIKAIALCTFGALSAAGSRTMRNIFKTYGGGTEYDLTGNFTFAGTDAEGWVVIQETNPDTLVAWTEDDLTNGQFGIEVVS
jgi:hypothetical protein